MEEGGSLRRSRQPATFLFPEPDENNSRPPIYFLNI